MKRKLLLCFLCLLCVMRITDLRAADFGLILDLTPGAGDYGAGGDFDFSGIIIPRFSVPIGDTGEIFISAGVKADYQNESWSVIPELLRTEFSTERLYRLIPRSLGHSAWGLCIRAFSAKTGSKLP